MNEIKSVDQIKDVTAEGVVTYELPAVTGTISIAEIKNSVEKATKALSEAQESVAYNKKQSETQQGYLETALANEITVRAELDKKMELLDSVTEKLAIVSPVVEEALQDIVA